MANETISPSMGLPIPGVGTTAGPTYASDLDNCLNIIDGHTHNYGSGVQITPSGMNINIDLPFNSNNAVSLRSVRFAPQAAPISGVADIGCLYESGVDLWYNDGLGNQVRITSSGGVVGSPGSITGLVSPASATYVPGTQTFVWQSGANTPTNMDAGSYIFRNLTPSSNGITVSAPTGLSSNYDIVLPALPTVNSFVTIDTSGNLGSGIPVNGLSVPNIVKRTTGQTVGIRGVAVSTSSGAFTTASPSIVSVTNLSVTITTQGNPVMLMIQPDGLGTAAYIGLLASDNQAQGAFYFYNGASVVCESFIEIQATSSATILDIPPASLSCLDLTVLNSPGTYTYTLQTILFHGVIISCQNCILVAYEIL
jgi:hypothetical protein